MNLSRKRNAEAPASGGLSACFPPRHRHGFFSSLNWFLGRESQELENSDSILDVDDPEGCRIAAAMVRKGPRRRQLDLSTSQRTVLSSETTIDALPSYTGLAPSDVPNYVKAKLPSSILTLPVTPNSVNNNTLNYGTTEKSELSHLPNSNSYNETKVTNEESSCNVKENETTAPAVSIDRNNMFWQELDTLREENISMRAEKEVYKLKYRMSTLKLYIQELFTALLYRTASGFQSTQVDGAIFEVVNNTCNRAVQCVVDVMDISAILLQCQSSFNEPPRCSALEKLDNDISKPLDTSNSKKNNNNHNNGCKLDNRYVIVAISKTLQAQLGIPEDTTHSLMKQEWTTVYAKTTSADLDQILQTYAWLSRLKSKYDYLGRQHILPEQYQETLLHSAQMDEFVTLLRLKEDNGKSNRGKSQEGTSALLLIPLFLANRLFILGIHTLQDLCCNNEENTTVAKVTTTKNRPYVNRNTEILLRKEAVKLMEKLILHIRNDLRAAVALLDQHDLSTSLSLGSATNSSFHL